MKKLIFCSLLLLFYATTVVGEQEKIEAPIWKVGDKWVLSDGLVEVIDVNENGYLVRFPKATQIFNKSTLNITYLLEGDKHKEFKGVRKRLLNFPLSVGKTWEDSFKSRPMRSTLASKEHFLLKNSLSWGGKKYQLEEENLEPLNWSITRKISIFQKKVRDGIGIPQM